VGAPDDSRMPFQFIQIGVHQVVTCLFTHAGHESG
jgi:hypothetical protein